MSNPGKEFPGGNHNLILLLIKQLPYLLGAGVLLRIGFLLAGIFELNKIGSKFPVFLFLLIILFFLKFDQGWNLALLFVFSVASGFFLGSLDPDCFQNSSILIFLTLSILTWFGAGLLRKNIFFPPFLVLVFIVVYFLGWIWIVFLSQQKSLFVAWIVFGIFFNIFVLVNILNKAKNEISGLNETPLAVDLIVLYIILFWFSAYLV